MRTIGIAGTAKNTGKTTTALEIIRQSTQAGLRIALTSIGYDGEEKDHITGLPKPRYLLPRGALVATAEQCLRAASAGYEVYGATPVHTALGPVVVAEIQEPGMVPIAGPHRATELAEILEIFHNLQADLTIVDGALNRCVPLIRTQGLVLATGAALDVRTSYVARHAEAIATLFTPPAAADSREWSHARISVRQNGRVSELESGSLLGEDTALGLYRSLGDTVQDLVIPGACEPRLLGRLLDEANARLSSARVILGSPLKLLASGDPMRWGALLAQVRQRGQRLEYLETIPLVCITVNPFYPRYEPETGTYSPAYVDAAGLLAAVRAAVEDIPVFDIRQPPEPNLLALFPD